MRHDLKIDVNVPNTPWLWSTDLGYHMCRRDVPFVQSPSIWLALTMSQREVFAAYTFRSRKKTESVLESFAKNAKPPLA